MLSNFFVNQISIKSLDPNSLITNGDASAPLLKSSRITFPTPKESKSWAATALIVVSTMQASYKKHDYSISWIRPTHRFHPFHTHILFIRIPWFYFLKPREPAWSSQHDHKLRFTAIFLTERICPLMSIVRCLSQAFIRLLNNDARHSKEESIPFHDYCHSTFVLWRLIIWAEHWARHLSSAASIFEIF